ncbi:MAG: KH domain-containing protein [Tissierellia bacterium]|nr:KH domain-containing protein [Tissierellia bacterium]
MVDFLRYIIGELIGPDKDFSVDEEVIGENVHLTVLLNSEDMGRVIGRQGRTAKSLRTLLKAIATKNNKTVRLDIHERQ